MHLPRMSVLVVIHWWPRRAHTPQNRSWKSSFFMVGKHWPLICRDRLKMGQGIPSFPTSWVWVFHPPCSQNPCEGQRCGVSPVRAAETLQLTSLAPQGHFSGSTSVVCVSCWCPLGCCAQGQHWLCSLVTPVSWGMCSEGLGPINTKPSSQITTYPNADFAELRWYFS